MPRFVLTKLLSRANTGLATRVADGPNPQCGAEEKMGLSPVHLSTCELLFRDVPSFQLPLKRHLFCSSRAFVLLWMMDIVMPQEFWEKQGILAQTTCNSRKMEAKSKLLFYQLLFYSFINTVVFTSIIAVNIIPKLSNT